MAEANGNPNAPPSHPPSSSSLSSSLATLAIHADDPINQTNDVAPALHVSTTFRYPNDPDKLVCVDDLDFSGRLPGGPVTGDAHVYSRATAPNTSRLELMLTSILAAPALTYASGLAAFNALLVHLHPRVVAIGAGYHGCHGVLKIYQRLTNCKIVDLFDEAAWDAAGLGAGDVVHIETPTNPTGLAIDIEHYVQLAHARGATCTLDATFAPPPLLDPWAWGVDFVMHSGTKYFGGHSDMLCGVLAVNRQRAEWQKAYWSLLGDRINLGSVMGSMEGWLGVRSLRTLHLRVTRQSASAEKLVAWLHAALHGQAAATVDGDEIVVADNDAAIVQAAVEKVEHASLQVADSPWLKKQMPNGFGPVFALSMKSESVARRLPSHLHLFHHATSLGGVESLIEWRRMSDQTVDPRLERLSIGVEDWQDLQEDLRRAFRELAAEDQGKK